MQPDWDDYKKLTWLIQYLHETLSIALVLSKDETKCIHWWIDMFFTIHPNMHGHTGATMSIGSSSVFSGSWKQKLITHSSTESEKMGVYDTLPQVLWTNKSLEEQGISIKETTVYQDDYFHGEEWQEI